MVVRGSKPCKRMGCREKGTCEGNKRVRPRAATSLYYLGALTLGQLRWRGAVLAVGADKGKRGYRTQASMRERSCGIVMQGQRMERLE
jgi:hypothetical protein